MKVLALMEGALQQPHDLCAKLSAAMTVTILAVGFSLWLRWRCRDLKSGSRPGTFLLASLKGLGSCERPLEPQAGTTIDEPAVKSAEVILRLLEGRQPLKLGPFTKHVVPEGQPRCGLVWMHGLGDDESGWARKLEEHFAVECHVGPCIFFLPRAPLQFVTTNQEISTSWFDFQKLPVDAMECPPRHGCSLTQALASCGMVHEAIDQVIAEGVPSDRIVVGGFSQGGAMALLSSLTYSKRVAGVIVFSGIVFFAEELQELMQPHTCDLEVLWAHGTRDRTLRPSLQDEGVAALRSSGLHVTMKKYNCAHSKTVEEIQDAAHFFNGLMGKQH